MSLERKNELFFKSYVMPVRGYSGVSLRNFKADDKDWFKKWRDSVGR